MVGHLTLSTNTRWQKKFMIYANHKPSIHVFWYYREVPHKESRHIDYINKFMRNAHNILAIYIQLVDALLWKKSQSIWRIPWLHKPRIRSWSIWDPTGHHDYSRSFDWRADFICQRLSNPVVPQASRLHMFDSQCGLSNPGFMTSTKAAATDHTWYSMEISVTAWNGDSIWC